MSAKRLTKDLISTKGLTKRFENISEYIILNDYVSQNYFIFPLLTKSFKPITNNLVMRRKSKGLSDESIKPSQTEASSF